MTDDLLTVSQAAERLGVSESFVKQRIKEGLLPAARFGKRVYQIRAADVATLTRRPAGRPKKQEEDTNAE